MRSEDSKAIRLLALRAACILSFAAVAAFGQQQVNLTAGPSSKTLPNGTVVPMWGYTCGAAVSGSTATCAKLNPAATDWSPVVISVPTGQSLQVNLTNSLSFANGNSVPTSLTIVGQLGGGLGTPGGADASPVHAIQDTTWPVAAAGAQNTPPSQGTRVRSFSTEVAVGATTALTWTSPRAGTYLLESGTHPSIQGPMGLYGMVVVTDASTGTAYSGVNYNADVNLLLSEIDPVQNAAVDAAVNTAGFSETKVWSGQPGGCGNPSSPTFHQCYPPTVNYSPLYYLFNGVAFDKTNSNASLFPTAPATGVTGQILVRLVNAGLRMHVPSIVGAQTGTPAVSGLTLVAEDGNLLPGAARVQNSVFLAPGKTHDVKINAPAAGSPALAVFDRQLSLSANGTARDAGMLAYIGANGAGLPLVPALVAAAANPDNYTSAIAGQTFTVSDPGKGVIANDINVSGVKLVGTPVGGTVNLKTDGTFTFAATAASGSFQYCGNGATTGPACATVTLGAAPIEAASGITVTADNYTSPLATHLTIKSPGVLLNDVDAAGYPLFVDTSAITPAAGLTLTVDKNGGFIASVPAAGTYTFTYKAKNSQGTQSTTAATVTLVFQTGTGLTVTVKDPKTVPALPAITDYRWIIEEDRTFFTDPTKTTNTGATNVQTLGTNFHTSYMPVVAQGCTGPISCESGQMFLNPATGTHDSAACDVGNGVCRAALYKDTTLPGQVHLDPTKRYYISVLPGDSGGGDTTHAMGGAQIAAGQTIVNVLVEPTPLPPGKVSVFVFQDDSPLNGEHDAGGGIDTLSPNEPGLGQFNITLFDDAGGPGDAAGQMTYDMFNMPLSNSLAGFKDPVTGKDACPITTQATSDPTASGITGVITVCPKYESDGVTLSPLAGQAVVANLPPGRYGVVATPGADRIARGEEWLQTNTLDGGKAHDSFIKVSEPSYFQEFGPAGYHVSVGFANPKIINDRKAAVCAALGTSVPPVACASTVTGKVTGARMSRTPDQRLYSSGSRDTYAYTQCYVSLGSPDGDDFAFQKCNDDGTFAFTGIPSGDWRVTIFDQWNDQVVDGISEPVRVNAATVNMGEIAAHQWKSDIYTRTFIDTNGDGVSQDSEAGLPLVSTNIRFRDGSFSNFNSTDLNGYAGFNEVFPLFNWYVVETYTTRFKSTGTHVVYDAGGPADGSPSCGVAGYPACGASSIGNLLARTKEDVPLPTALRVPGSRYCANADCPAGDTAGGSTGRVDAPWVSSYGWQGFAGQNSFLEFGKKPYADKENGGIFGHVVYASTRPFDDPALLLQLSWEPLIPNVTINLYQEGTAPDGSQTLKLVDTTKTTSFDDWAQGFRSDGAPNMNCPGQTLTDPFFYTLKDQPMHLNPGTIPNNSQFKCYDGMHNWNQLQPAPYDGMYNFPSVTGIVPATGKPAGTNCTICVPNPDTTDPYRTGQPMLPPGKYVVEVVVPPNYELVKEEDKNILIGDTYVAPVTAQFAGLGNIFILPDQASVADAYNPNNAQNPTTNLGAHPRHEGDTGSVESFWPCVGAERVVPDFVSLYPGSAQVAPFAGATRRLCDRKEVILDDQMQVLAKFYLFTSAHVASHFTGVITDDFRAEFDPYSPQFGEKFAPANLPVSVKDWAGNEVGRVYADQWGAYNGLSYSSWGVNPPDPSGYVPQMMVLCMNDAGSGQAPDALFQAGYSQFCYELPFMPGQTGYFDTPVVPTSAFSDGYNRAECSYPDATPAVSQVNGDGVGPWIAASGTTHPITITALGDLPVDNYGYSGPQASAAPFNQQTITRHYGFGTQCTSPTAGNPTCNTLSSVTIGGVPATISSWNDTSIVVTLPSTGTQVPACGIQQRNTPTGTTTARCGEVLITAGNGKSSIDTVTLTIGGKAPTRVLPGQKIQTVIDAAAPGDLIIVPPGSYTEMLLMWKPVRLQGVGAASTVISATAHPASEEKLGAWRRQVVCLFGLSLNGRPTSSTNPFDDPSDTANNGAPFTCSPSMFFHVDRLPLEATVGWDATLNGNLAEMLQEPTLMGAYEGSAITVLSKGVNFHGGDPFAADTFPTGTTLLGSTTADCSDGAAGNFTSNFKCNPSRIDGLSITNSSQGGGGIYVHAWGHNLEISNNRVHNNQGTLSGGIQVGQGEHPTAYLAGAGAANAAPGSCDTANHPANTQLPYCFDLNVNVHNNAISFNSSEGDELFSATPAGAGGITFCTGADNYQFNYNWLCGNLSSGDGAGLAHLGFAPNGHIEHNSILFNQSTNPTVPTNGGGMVIMGAPDLDPTCPGPPDADCGAGTGIGDGIGNGLVINANLIMGNAAESGSGGGIRFQAVNGTEVSTFPTAPTNWYSVSVTNNIIVNNVAGWDGAGVSLKDSLVVNMINNTVASNDTTASSGILFGAFFAPQASDPSIPPCTQNCGNDSASQPAGLVAAGNSPGLLIAAATATCPAGHQTNNTNRECRKISFPLLDNNVFWQNRAFHITVGGLAGGLVNQQNVVTLVPALNQTVTGQCVSSPAPVYWDLGVRGDTGPGNHASGFTLAPRYSVLTNTTEVGVGTNDFAGTANNPNLASQYCNGARVPPEFGGSGYLVPPGTYEGNGSPLPVFNLTAGATVDEGNNWININFGPLALTNPVTKAVLGDYRLTAASASAINKIPNTAATYSEAPTLDFFNTPRKSNNAVDIGAVEFTGVVVPLPIASVTGGPLAFGNVATGTTSAAQTLTLHNTGTASLTGITLVFSSPLYTRPAGAAGGTCGTTLAQTTPGTCTINVVFSPTAVGLVNATLSITGNATVTGSPVALSGTGVAPVIAATLTPTSWTIAQTRNCPGTGIAGVLACTLDPAQVFTLRNTGNVPLTGIAQAALAGTATNVANYNVVRALSTCGPTGNGQLIANTTLAPNATCVVTVQFKPLTAQPAGAKPASVSVTDGAGTQTSTLSGTAN